MKQCILKKKQCVFLSKKREEGKFDLFLTIEQIVGDEKMFSLKDCIKVLDRMKIVGEDLLDIDKESGGPQSSKEKKEDSETNEMTSYTNNL